MNNVILLTISLFGLFSCKSSNPPTLIIDSSHVKSINDTTTSSILILKNTGDKTLVLEDFSSSCDCTILNLKKGDSILGGKSLEVPFTIQRNKLDTTKKIINVVFKSNSKPILNSVKFVI